MKTLSILKHNKEEFSLAVETFATTFNTSYFEALQEVSEQRQLEIETVAKLITAKLKTLLEAEAQELNLLKNKPPRLDLTKAEEPH